MDAPSIPNAGDTAPPPPPFRPAVSNPTPPPPPPAAPVVNKVVPKSGFPKKLIFLILGAVVLVLGGILLARLLATRTSSEAVTLKWWGLWETNEVVQPLIDEYQAAHPNVKIEYVFSSHREYRERLQNALSSGTGPDIFRLHNSWIPMFRTDLATVPAKVYSASEFDTIFYPAAKSDLRVGSNYVAIPLEFDGLAMYVNEDLLAKGGKTVPSTWEDLRRTAIDLSVCDSEDGRCSSGSRVLVSGAAMGTADNVDHWQDIVSLLMLQNNVNLNSITGQPAEEVLQYYTIFNRSDHIWDSTLPNSTLAFAQGKVAIMFAPSWRVFDVKSLNPTLKFNTYPVPQLPLDPSRGEKPVTWASYWVEGVNKKSPSADAAWDFLKFLSTPESLQKMYENATKTGRAFGEPYPRTDMAGQLSSAPLVGAYISQAPNARSWYLASFTHDGPTGINSRLSTYFADAINAVSLGRGAAEAVTTLNAGINQILSQYGIQTSQGF
jgi:multiple sugar transport system substrate-binding protein